jgi:plasmid stability protein
MVALQIRDVPEAVRDTLTERARTRGQSLQSYLREIVLREASFANNALVLDGIATWNQGSGATLEDVLMALDASRKDTHA